MHFSDDVEDSDGKRFQAWIVRACLNTVCYISTQQCLDGDKTQLKE